MITPNQDLTTGSISGHIRRIAIPASIGFLFNTLFYVVDTWCAGRFVSTDALSALSATFPLFFIIIAVCNGLSIATTTLVANALGAGRPQEADRISGQAFGLAVIISLGMAVVGPMFAERLLAATGCGGEALRLGTRYMQILFVGAPGFFLTQVLTAPLTARGNTRAFRNTIVLGCLINGLLDPWFVLGGFGLPAMGFDGIAISTVLIQAFSVVYVAGLAAKAGCLNATWRASLMPSVSDALAIIRQGLPATLNMLNIAIGVFIINRLASGFGDAAIAAYGVATRVEQLALLPTIGLNFATLALVGQNYGAGRLDRVRETMYTALKAGVALCLVGGVFLIAAGPWLMAKFAGPEATEVMTIGQGYLRVAALLLFAYVLIFVTIYTLQGLKRPGFGLAVSLSRQVLFPLALYPIFIRHFGVNGLWYGIATVNGCAALVSFGYAWWVLRRISPPSTPAPAAPAVTAAAEAEAEAANTVE
jgi:putative MATE family efflux protein